MTREEFNDKLKETWGRAKEQRTLMLKLLFEILEEGRGQSMNSAIDSAVKELSDMPEKEFNEMLNKGEQTVTLTKKQLEDAWDNEVSGMSPINEERCFKSFYKALGFSDD